jgi:F0F1-type ATP synthase assembly protein I
MNSQKPKKQLNKYIQISGIAIQMALTIVLGSFIGIKLDKKFPNKNNLFTVIFTLIFVIISLYQVVKRFTNHSNKDED